MRRLYPVLGVFVSLMLGVVALASAETTDIQSVSSSLSTNVIGEPFTVSVTVKNLGPDTYDSSAPLPFTAGTAIGRQLSITVDIDEPSKPGRPGTESLVCTGSVTQDFDVVLLPDSSAVLTLTTPFPPCQSRQVRVTARATVGQGFTDPDTTNNVSQTIIQRVDAAPATGWWGLAALASLLGGTLWWAARRNAGRTVA